MTRAYIIAEAGVNHNGSLDLAHKMVDIARECGADAVKFQTFRASALASRRAPLAEYQKKGVGAADQISMLKKYELSNEAHRELKEHCEERGIEFLSTAFDIESLNVLVSLKVRRLKIPSGEITNLPLLRSIGHLQKPTILSTGMSTLSDVEGAVEVLLQCGVSRQELTILHCTSAYPTPSGQANLRAMHTLKHAFNCDVGYSDHTEGIHIAIAAVAIGATTIEKHFTTDRSLPGPDHRASVEPDQLAALVRSIRDVEQSLGDGIKNLMPAEAMNRLPARRSIVAARNISPGEVIEKDMLACRRPGDGLSPMRLDELLGRRAPKFFAQDEPIEL